MNDETPTPLFSAMCRNEAASPIERETALLTDFAALQHEASELRRRVEEAVRDRSSALMSLKEQSARLTASEAARDSAVMAQQMTCELGQQMARQLAASEAAQLAMRTALDAVWTGVCEMAKDARTDYKLPRLAQLDLQAITDQENKVKAALTSPPPAVVSRDLAEKLADALETIGGYDGQSLWHDDRDDAAADMLYIAQEAHAEFRAAYPKEGAKS